MKYQLHFGNMITEKLYYQFKYCVFSITHINNLFFFSFHFSTWDIINKVRNPKQTPYVILLIFSYVSFTKNRPIQNVGIQTKRTRYHTHTRVHFNCLKNTTAVRILTYLTHKVLTILTSYHTVWRVYQGLNIYFNQPTFFVNHIWN